MLTKELKEQLTDTSIYNELEEFMTYYQITNEELEQYIKHFEYHTKRKVDNNSLKFFLEFTIFTDKIQAKNPSEFVQKFYKSELKSLLKSKLFNHTDSSDILNHIDFNKIFEDLYEEYYISYFELDYKEPEFLYTSRQD